jgi:isopenicillin-N epimerase
MVSVELDGVGAAYTTGNFHKWACAPRAAAFLHVRKDRQAIVHPLAVSHGRNSPRTDRSRFLLEHDWTGTFDPTPYLCVPASLQFLAKLAPGGLSAWMDGNRAAAAAARRTLCDALDLPAPCPDDMIGAMASLQLPSPHSPLPITGGPLDPLQQALLDRYGVQIPVFPFPAPPSRMIRVSTPAYVTPADIERLVVGLRELGFARAA